MQAEFLFFLSGGLFLGFISGANYMGNIFGTAVGTKMLSFQSAAIICSVFIILGAVIGGGGTSATIGKLGMISTMSGAFVATVAAFSSIFIMTRTGIPVSSTGAIVGGIIGWNLFTGKAVDLSVFTQIVLSWVASPFISCIFAMLLMLAVRKFLHRVNIPILYQDIFVRTALILTGAFAAYSLGANNIGNIVGVFIPSLHISPIEFFGFISLSPERELFLLGGIAIAFGVFMYSRKVINTIGKGIYELTPISAWVVVMAHSIVMFLFASQSLHNFLVSHGLPAIPLVPISSSEAVIGAVIGIALLKKGRGLQTKPLGRIALGWITCPLFSIFLSYALMCLLSIKVEV